MKFVRLADILPAQEFIQQLASVGRPSGDFVTWLAKMYRDRWQLKAQTILYNELTAVFVDHCTQNGGRPGERPDLCPESEWSDRLDDAMRDYLIDLQDYLGRSFIEETTVGGTYVDDANIAVTARDVARRAFEGYQTRYTAPPKVEAVVKSAGAILSSGGVDSITVQQLGTQYGVPVVFTEADLKPLTDAIAATPPLPPPLPKAPVVDFPYTRSVVGKFVAKAGGDPSLLNRDILTDLFLQLTDEETTAVALQQLGGTQDLVKEVRDQYKRMEQQHGEIYANNGEWIMNLISSVAGSLADVVFAPEGLSGQLVPPTPPSVIMPPLPPAIPLAALPNVAPLPLQPAPAAVVPAAPLPLPLPGAPTVVITPPALPPIEGKKPRRRREAGTPLATPPAPGSNIVIEAAPLAPIVGMLRTLKICGMSEKELYEVLDLSRTQYSNLVQGRVAAPALTPTQRDFFAKTIREKMVALTDAYKVLE